MGYHEKSYTNKNHDVMLLSNAIEELIKFPGMDRLVSIRELNEQLKTFDFSISTKRTFQSSIEVFSRLYRIFVKINVDIVYNHVNRTKGAYNNESLQQSISVTNATLREMYSYYSVNSTTLEYGNYINGYGCSLLALISILSGAKKKFSMLPMFKLFLEDFNTFVDVGSYYNKHFCFEKVGSDGRVYNNHTDAQGNSMYILPEATETHLTEKSHLFSKLDNYTVSSIENIRHDVINANTEFKSKANGFFAWECEYEFSVLNKYIGPERLIKVILLLALNTLAIYKAYSKND